MKIVVLASFASSLVNFRGHLIEQMVKSGHAVTACAPGDDPAIAAAMAEYGASYRAIELDRTGTSMLADLGTIRRLRALFAELRPDVLFAYTAKPVIYGGIAAWFAGVPRAYALITGLGYMFTEGGGLKRGLLRRATSGLYRFGLSRCAGVFFQNGDDLEEFKARRIVNGGQTLIRVDGSGVDVQAFAHVPPAVEPPVFLLIARLLADKGIREYAAAARTLRARFPDARFQLLGPKDDHPNAISAAELAAWQDEGVIDYLGETADVRPHLQACSVYVLPSYREGMPRTVLEAMATGRAIVTTDVPGCRDTIEAGENGFLVPPRDPDALAQAMIRFIEKPALADIMGQVSRKIAERRFDVHGVNRVMLQAMDLL